MWTFFHLNNLGHGQHGMVYWHVCACVCCVQAGVWDNDDRCVCVCVWGEASIETALIRKMGRELGLMLLELRKGSLNHPQFRSKPI